MIVFGPFRLFPEQRLLFQGSSPLRLGSRAREIILTLVERAGQVVTKCELMARVWPGVTVEEGTLRVHICALRKALGGGQFDGQYIENVNGLGYRFVGRIEHVTEPVALVARTAPPAPIRAHSAAPLTRMIGRDGVVETLSQRLREKRLLTVAGPGGIGKTTVANATMEQLRGDYMDGVRFVDFASISDPQFVPATLAGALGVAPLTMNPLHDAAEHLANHQMLIVLDNCEHVIAAVAQLVETLLAKTTEVHILATSREPLRAQGEWILRLPPLEVPPRSESLTAQEALEYSAMQMFVEHAMASHHAFELIDANAHAAAEICRRLDGLPLAIELAAAHVGLFGIRGLVAHLDDLLDLLTQGRRTALPRQQTLRATLDWSFNLLSEPERVALRRLCVFSESFDLEAARAVVAHDDIGSVEVLDIVSSLTAKSLIVADSDEAGSFRLFQTTRSYALSSAHAHQ